MSDNGMMVVDALKQFDRTILDDAPESLDVTSLGDGLKLVKKDIVELDHEFATWILEIKEFCADRPLDNNHVLRLKTAMERGTFMPEQVALITCKCENVEYRMNGQHTAWARLEMPDKYRCPVSHLRYTAKTENDMRRLYASLDRGKPRDKATVVCSYMYGTEEWAGHSRSICKLLAEGLGFWLWPSGHVRKCRDGDDRAFLLMTEHMELGHKVAENIPKKMGGEERHIQRASVIAAMFATFQIDADAAADFWMAVRYGTGFADKSDPRLVLRNALMGSNAQRCGSDKSKKVVSSEEMYRWCIHAWNNWRSKKPTKHVRAVLTEERPKAK